MSAKSLWGARARGARASSGPWAHRPTTKPTSPGATGALDQYVSALADGGAEQVPNAVGEGQAERSADDNPKDGAADVAAA